MLVEADLRRLQGSERELVDAVVLACGRLPGEARGTGDPERPELGRPLRDASSTPAAIAAGSAGSKATAASPTTSGSDPARETATGHPQAMASSGGSPKPS